MVLPVPRLAGVVVLLGFLALVGCSEAPQRPTPEPPRVSVKHPEMRQITDYEEFNGWLRADKEVDLRSRIRGEIKKVEFKNGDPVKENDVLFLIDPEPFEIDKARTEDTLKIYQAQKVAAEKEEARLRSLLSKGGASQQQVDKAEADAKSLEAQISATQNAIKRIEKDLDYCKIKAPIAGVLGEAQLTEGNFVNAGGTDPILTTIRSVDPIRVYFNVDERSLRKYGASNNAKGRTVSEILTGLKDTQAPVKFALDGEKEFTHEANLVFGDNQIRAATGTILLYAVAKNPKGKYLPGSRVRVRLPVSQAEETYLVDETAILADQSKRYILTVNDKNIAERRNVILDELTDDGMRAITPEDKLPEGEKLTDWWVIVDNLQRVRINYPVTPIKPDATPAETQPNTSEK